LLKEAVALFNGIVDDAIRRWRPQQTRLYRNYSTRFGDNSLRMNNNTAPQSEVYGSKEFVFTDDLDGTNRMFYNLRDAEGQDS